MALVIGLIGATGRMGQAILRIAADDAGLRIMALGRGAQADHLEGVDVLIDFSSPPGLASALCLARQAEIPIVSGTTGVSDALMLEVAETATRVAVLHATNMSLGVAVLAQLVERAAAALPSSFEPELVEVHHRRKKDSPSGTALTLADAVDRGRGVLHRRVSGRDGLVGERATDELGVLAVRGGDVVGEHTVFFFGDGERLELTHRATDRAIFARGALAAARWIVGRPAGRYAIADVVAPLS